MAHPVIMSKFGFTQESSEIVRWLKKPGDAVEPGDPLVEVSTDKVNMEIEATVAGILDGVRYRVGDTVPVTEIIAYIRSPNEPPLTTEITVSSQVTSLSSTEKTTDVRATPVATNLAQENSVDLGLVTGTGPGGQITKRDVEKYLTDQTTSDIFPSKPSAVPAARRLARELGVELAQIQGTGPRGRIQSADVQVARLRQAEISKSQSVPVPTKIVGPTVAGLNITRTIPFIGMRQTIATRLQKSAQDAPHIYFDAEIDVTAVESLRAYANQRLKEGESRISLTAIIAKACAWALKRNPIVNSRLDGDKILVLADVNVGVAVALEEGLIVPVVRSVDQKGLAQIAIEIADLAERARNNRLRPDDVMDGTFTVSNLGMFGVDRFTAIINPPQSAILAVSRVRKQFVPDEHDQPIVKPLLTVTLSADHRVIDGAIAARFLSDVREALEHPGLLAV